MSRTDDSSAAPWRAGLQAARATALPGFALQAGALALVLAYYHHTAPREALTRLMAFREELGVVFSIVSTGIFGGVIPALYLRARRATRNRYTIAQAAGITAFWAYKGFEIDLLYRLQARFVGEGTAPATIALKTIFDQLVYCPLIAVPVTVLVYAWVDAHYVVAPVRADVRRPRWYARRVLPVLLSNLGVWVPAVCIIYALPTPLQLPLQNLVLCFFTLLLAHVTAREASADTTAKPAKSLERRAA
jgi:hypothetical protein